MTKNLIIKVLRTNDERYYVFWCPFCRSFHFHDYESGKGNVKSKCINEDSPYFRDNYIIREFSEIEIDMLRLPINKIEE